MTDDRHLDRARLAEFAELAGAERQTALGHLRRCAACRAGLAAVDPSHLFALLGAEPLPAAILDEVSAGVAAALRQRAPAASGRRRWLPVAAVAAGIALAALLSVALLERPGGPGGAEGLARRVDEPRAPVGDALPVGLAAVELLSSAGGRAEVFDLTIGETQVVMIFDEGLEL